MEPGREVYVNIALLRGLVCSILLNSISRIEQVYQLSNHIKSYRILTYNHTNVEVLNKTMDACSTRCGVRVRALYKLVSLYAIDARRPFYSLYFPLSFSSLLWLTFLEFVVYSIAYCVLPWHQHQQHHETPPHSHIRIVLLRSFLNSLPGPQ
jgi:hypothetical protein